MWSKLINLLSAASCTRQQFNVSGLETSIVKMYEESQILTCENLETYLELEAFEQEAIWILTGMKHDDYENPLYDILEEEEDDLTDEDIEYGEYLTDYDY